MTVGVAGYYEITADGAGGGGGGYNSAGGLGAMASGEIYLQAGARLELVVGGAGQGSSSSGGGGSFAIETNKGSGVVDVNEVIAGGGGGHGGSGGGGGGGSIVDASVSHVWKVVGTNSGNGFITITAVPCYRRGTRILTERGEVSLENLAVGDCVEIASGATMPIRWIGHRRIHIGRHPQPELARPVRIEAGALRADLPARDLCVSPEHALWLEDALIPARDLVNGATIRQEAWSVVEYFHVELDSHEILLAEGVPAESYLNCDNRSSFDNSPDGVVTLHPDWRARTTSRPFGSAALAVRLQAFFPNAPVDWDAQRRSLLSRRLDACARRPHGSISCTIRARRAPWPARSALCRSDRGCRKLLRLSRAGACGVSPNTKSLKGRLVS